MVRRSRLQPLVTVGFLVLLGACQSSATDPDVCGGRVLFGRPNDKTGLDETQCRPECRCGGRTWRAPDYTEDDADALLEFVQTTPYAELTSDPYPAGAPEPAGPDVVCGVVLEAPGSKNYSLVTYANRDEAEYAGAHITHVGPCGLCSTLQDLGVYMRENDLTSPVQACGVRYFEGPMEGHMECLLDLGFTLPCAQIWYYNTIHTRQVCQDVCIANLGRKYHHSIDGRLNDCLVCDEVNSGPVFKAVAGRTRRNTGLPNAMCRPCSEVTPIEHHYD